MPPFCAFVIEQVGEEKADAMYAKFAATLAHEEYTVWKLTDELSMSNDKE